MIVVVYVGPVRAKYFKRFLQTGFLPCRVHKLIAQPPKQQNKTGKTMKSVHRVKSGMFSWSVFAYVYMTCGHVQYLAKNLR